VSSNTFQTCLYEFDQAECLLRLSAPRYLSWAREEFGQVGYLILKECFVNGSLTR
jgi:hypothetical protein